MCGFCPLFGPPSAGKGYGGGSYGHPGYPSQPGYAGYAGYAGFGGHPGAGRESMLKLGQLVGLSAVAAVGTLSHIYTVSACVVGDRLRKKGGHPITELHATVLSPVYQRKGINIINFVLRCYNIEL